MDADEGVKNIIEAARLIAENDRTFTIRGEFLDTDYITRYSLGIWEQLNPKPVNLTPGALGVRSEE